mmetsp:Transcript_28989/g.53527  ORF Transcript_28989/g.53527 Transcript_28989/m.53527 type:complete len:132 (-) Transcript_28989:198-593(-)
MHLHDRSLQLLALERQIESDVSSEPNDRIHSTCPRSIGQPTDNFDSRNLSKTPSAFYESCEECSGHNNTQLKESVQMSNVAISSQSKHQVSIERTMVGVPGQNNPAKSASKMLDIQSLERSWTLAKCQNAK